MKNLEILIKENLNLAQARTGVISIGINMQCKRVITKSVLYKENGRWCLRNGGINMYCDNLSDLYLDTKENKKELRKTI